MSNDVLDNNKFQNKSLLRVENAVKSAIKDYGTPYSARDPERCIPWEGLVSWIRGYLRNGGRDKTLSRPTIEHNVEDLAGGDKDGPFQHRPKGLPLEVRLKDGAAVVLVAAPSNRKRKRKEQ